MYILNTILAFQAQPSEAEQAGYVVGKLLGQLTFFAILLAIVLGVVFFIKYIKKKNRK